MSRGKIDRNSVATMDSLQFNFGHSENCRSLIFFFVIMSVFDCQYDIPREKFGREIWAKKIQLFSRGIYTFDRIHRH